MDDPMRLRDSIFENYNTGLSKVSSNASNPTDALVPGPFNLTRPEHISAERILKNIDAMFIPQYVAALEKSKHVLSTYIQQLGEMNERIEKALEGEIRKSAQSTLLKRVSAIKDTFEKLQAHIDASKERLSA